MTRRVKLIFNPYADGGRGWRRAAALQAAVELAGGAEWTGTDHPTHATDLALEAAQDGFDVVVAVGGDGTVHEIVNGLMQVERERRPALAMVPIGTGNDFSAGAGASFDKERAIRQAFTGDSWPIDIGEVTDATGRSEYFGNVLGIGFDAASLINSQDIPMLQGMPLYFAAAVRTILRDLDPIHVRIRTDEEEIERELLLAAFCNGHREGGGFRLAPNAVMDDGSFDYVTCSHTSRAMMFRLIPEFLRGTHERFDLVETGRFRNLTLSADRPLLIHTDGEVFATAGSDVRELAIRMHPAAIDVIV